MQFRSLINSIGSSLERVWLRSKFDILPGENDFLESTWYNCLVWKKLLSGRTTLQFLDYLVRDIESDLSNPQLSERKANILKEFQKALHNSLVREEIVLFLDKTAFSPEDCSRLWQNIHAAWRNSAVSAVLAPARTSAPVSQAGAIKDRSPDASGEGGMNGFSAKTYAIAAQIHFELAGKGAEYEALSHGDPGYDRGQ